MNIKAIIELDFSKIRDVDQLYEALAEKWLFAFKGVEKI